MNGPHQGQRVARAGAPPERATGAVVMVHGRGADPENILQLVTALGHPGFAYLAPAAAGGSWYPNGFMAPIATNEPGITSGLAAIGAVLDSLAAAGVPPERTVLLGFSQGGCLCVEFAARNARRYGGLAVLSGGLIGPDGTVREYPGSFAGTPAFLGCSDVDPHIPVERVEETARVLDRMGAAVTARLYRGMGHLVNDDETEAVREMLDALEAARDPDMPGERAEGENLP
jgi:phospholipase/carboxylesterase